MRIGSTRGDPARPGRRQVARALGREPVELAATGGEDFELCACVPARAQGLPDGLTWIGEVVAGPVGVEWLGAPPGAEAWRGYEH